jgi:multicomponent Na+:H+ antiporter subunit D
MKTVIRIYTPRDKDTNFTKVRVAEHPLYNVALIFMIILNMILGCCSQPIVNWITKGLEMFG